MSRDPDLNYLFFGSGQMIRITTHTVTEECLLTDDLLDGDRLEDEGRVNVVLVDRALDEDHPAVLLVRQKVSHFTRIPHHPHRVQDNFS